VIDKDVMRARIQLSVRIMKYFPPRAKGKESQIRVKMATSGNLTGILSEARAVLVNLGKLAAARAVVRSLS
jgi:hypothetical protein